VQSWLEDSPWWPATNSGGDDVVNLEDAEDNLEALKCLLLVLLVGGWWRRQGGNLKQVGAGVKSVSRDQIYSTRGRICNFGGQIDNQDN
jgi:hypothetical protein